MKPEYEGLVRSVTQWSLWSYKDKCYQVMTVTTGLLSQDAEGEWVPTVIYTAYQEWASSHETHIATLDLRFARPITEFSKKFVRFIPEKKK